VSGCAFVFVDQARGVRKLGSVALNGRFAGGTEFNAPHTPEPGDVDPKPAQQRRALFS